MTTEQTTLELADYLDFLEQELIGADVDLKLPKNLISPGIWVDRIRTTAAAAQTLASTIAAVYGSFDAEDCARIDREWAKQRGLAIAALLPTKLTGEMACVLEDCDGPEKQKPEAFTALIEMYQPMWNRLLATVSQPVAYALREIGDEPKDGTPFLGYLAALKVSHFVCWWGDSIKTSKPYICILGIGEIWDHKLFPTHWAPLPLFAALPPPTPGDTGADETRFITKEDREYASELLSDLTSDDLPRLEIAAQWFRKARVEHSLPGNRTATPPPFPAPGEATVSEFTNELVNTIRITIEGPTSKSTNDLTPRETAELNKALTRHFAPGERTMVAEIAFDPTNHHNALKCPYCNPKGLTFAAPGEVAGGGEAVAWRWRTRPEDNWAFSNVRLSLNDIGRTASTFQEEPLYATLSPGGGAVEALLRKIFDCDNPEMMRGFANRALSALPPAHSPTPAGDAGTENQLGSSERLGPHYDGTTIDNQQLHGTTRRNQPVVAAGETASSITGIEAAKFIADYLKMRSTELDAGDAANIIHILHANGVKFQPATNWKEIDRARGRSEWVKALRESLSSVSRPERGPTTSSPADSALSRRLPE